MDIFIKILVSFCLLFLSNLIVKADFPTVKTPLGVVVGTYKNSFHERKFRAFEGIPYALPPIGHRRFEPPEPITRWEKELIANNTNTQCKQYLQYPKKLNEYLEGNEDCLYLNIYVPEINETNKLLPVLFFLHGGAFQYEKGSSFGPKYLMDWDIILVTINYRLGLFGFLSTEDSILPGNMGLKDQSMALKWVNNYIKYFGGDPKKITISGHSAGGVSVNYHYLSPLSKGLFRNGISFSGNSFNCWAQAKNSLEKALKLGNILNCPTNNITVMVECLKYKPADKLANASKYFQFWRYNPFTPFGPVIEKSGTNAFIDRSPIKIIESGDIEDLPWISGVANEDGLYPTAEYVNNDKILQDLDKNWDSIAPHLLDFDYTIPKTQQNEISEKIRNFYFGTRKIDKASVSNLIRMVSDRIFNYGTEDIVKLIAKRIKSPTWFYLYNYRANNSFSNFLTKTDINFGTSHNDELILIFDTVFATRDFSKEDLEMQKKLINFIVSFAENSVPDMGLKWEEVDPYSDKFNYLHIKGPNDIKMVEDNNFGNRIFWNNTNFNENK